MTSGQRPGARRVVWLIIVLAIAAALAWWWWSGRTPATALSERGLLPPHAATGEQATAPPVSTGPAAHTAASAPGETSGNLAEDNSNATMGSETAEPAELPVDAEPVAEDAPGVRGEPAAQSESGAGEPVAISGLSETAAAGARQPAVIEYPLPALPADRTLQADGVEPALDTLLHPGGGEKFLLSADFARRFVATVDSLGRSFASPLLWPISPVPGRFTLEERDGQTYISPDNYKRYVPLVRLAETMDARATIDLYVRMYPQLQAAYVELGFPGAYFNDRLIAVMDLLLASPEPKTPPRVEHVEVPNRPAPVRPWTNYDFSDPALDRLTAGQKIMVRVGPDNERRLKAKLSELRRELLTRVLPRR